MAKWMTKSLNSLDISRSAWETSQLNDIVKSVENYYEAFNHILENLQQKLRNNRFHMLDHDSCLDMKTGLIFPQLDKNTMPAYTLRDFNRMIYGIENFSEKTSWKCQNWNGQIMMAFELSNLLSADNPYMHGKSLSVDVQRIKISDKSPDLLLEDLMSMQTLLDEEKFNGTYLISGEFACPNGRYNVYSMRTGKVEQTNNGRAVAAVIPVVRLFNPKLELNKIYVWDIMIQLHKLDLHFCFNNTNVGTAITDTALAVLLKKSDRLYFDGDKKNEIESYLVYADKKDLYKLNKNKLIKDLRSNCCILSMDDKKIALKQQPAQNDVISPFSVTEDILNCDHKRANLVPYSPRILTDINAGHWELNEKHSDQEETVKISLTEPLVARPPQLDIHQSGICAIDFGTKSTVVACRDRTEQLLRVGKGDWSKAPVPEDYENPTAIELRDLQSFLAAYDAREGRPFTEWEQMTVSHQALARLLENMDQISAQSVFAELKEWANSKGSLRKLRDGQGREVVLKPYGELDEKKDFDPIEKYAYYLGLYINNMNTGIYLEYVLSYPVTYPVEVRDHLVRSFTRGLKKSLPPALLADKEAMEDFRVYAGASEPAAYAACALKEMGKHDKKMRPTPEQPLFYAVFDFGGGTTDFDYGLWRLPKEDERGYNFVIEHFDAGGDPYLGGENLLRQMAYTVFTKNLDIMRKEQISLSLPPECQPFAGAELLLNDSDAAQLNLRRLSEALRPLWETSVQGEKALGNSKLAVKLFTEKEPVEVQLQADAKELLALLKARIASGVDNFFVNLEHAFAQRLTGKQPQVHILLAGNSCKSPLVKELFDEKIKQASKEFEQILLENSGEEASAAQFFVLHAPLGAGEPDPNELDRIPTGKTGVAFGLIDCRRGGNDVKVIRLDEDSSREAPFRYYLGRIGRFDEFEVLIGKKVGYGLWAPYIHIDDDRFELWYTAEAKALEGGYGPNDLPTPKKCRLHYHKGVSGGQVYLRKVGPTKVEYTVGTQEGLAKDEFLADVGSCELEG